MRQESDTILSMNHNRHLISLAVLLIVLTAILLGLLSIKEVNVGVTAPTANNISNNLPNGISARLTGHAEVDSLDMKITISAVVHMRKEVGQDGKEINIAEVAGGASGQTKVLKNFRAVVTELVPPAANQDYWCVNSVINIPADAKGTNWVWYVKNLIDGDRITFTNGQGLTCATVPIPDSGAFQPVSRGNFRGEVRN